MPQELTELTPAELKARLDAGDKLVILDVRNQDEYQAWKVEGKHAAPMTNIPYFDFIEDEEAAIARMPYGQDDTIVVVCAKGGSSDFVATQLREHGYKAVNMTEGMEGWGETYLPREVEASDRFTLLQFDRFGKGCLSYMIGSGDEALVVDPGRHHELYEQEAAKRGWRITHVVDTHVHADHISGAPSLAADTGAHYHLHEGDASFGKLHVEAPAQLKLGAIAIDVLQEHTPGHTPGSISLIVDHRYLISGDTLFVASVGRPDLGGHVDEWAHDLYWTLVNKVQALGDDVVVLPAHYGSLEEARPDGIIAGALGEIRAKNPALHIQHEDEFIAFIKSNMRPSPAIYGEIRKVNLGLVEACNDQRRALEIGKNECAASRARA